MRVVLFPVSAVLAEILGRDICEADWVPSCTRTNTEPIGWDDMTFLLQLEIHGHPEWNARLDGWSQRTVRALAFDQAGPGAN
jgi:hypothetical protein